VNQGVSHADLSTRQRPKLATVCGLLALVMILAFAGIAAWNYSRHGVPGIWTALLSVVTCWLAATSALVVAALFTNTPQALQGQLGSIILRTVVPLVFAIFLEQQVPFLAQTGLFATMVPAYLVALATETLLSVWLIGPARSVAKAS
jgi:hypothetical protein